MIPSSRTLDSLVELQAPKTSTPSTSSSGYGSQAVSSTNLTSEDSMSLRSISVDETPDLENRPILQTDLKPVDEQTDKEVDKDCESVCSDNNDKGSDIIKNDSHDNVPSNNITQLDNNSTTDTSEINNTTSTNNKVYNNENDKVLEYDSPCEGTSIVKTKLLPGKVSENLNKP